MYSYSPNQTLTGSTGVIEHYTQMLWAKTEQVGCGYMAHQVYDDADLRYERVWKLISPFVEKKSLNKISGYLSPL